MDRVVKMLILVILIVLVVFHHAATHGGAFYNPLNLFSHEAVVAFLAGMVAALALWSRARARLVEK